MKGLTAEERRLIDEAVDAGRVNKVPPGQSSYEVKWDGKALRYSDPDAARSAAGFTSRGKRKDPVVAARRVKVRDMVEQGKTRAEIAEALGVSIPVVQKDASSLGVSFPKRRSEDAARSRYDDKVAKDRQAVAEAFDGRRTALEISELVGVDRRTVLDHLKALDLSAPHGKPGPKSSARSGAIAQRRERVAALVAGGSGVTEIARTLGVSNATIYLDCAKLNLEPPKGRRRSKTGRDVAADRKSAVVGKKQALVRDRRRFKTVPVPMGDPGKLAPADAKATIFPERVFDPDGTEALLKDGCNQSKIGGDVLVGWLKGARIYTLTLEERTTCPATCRHWRGCYGNSMPYSRRWRHGGDLMRHLEREIGELCDRHDRILIRLHVLGDFWSVAYVDFWGRMIERHAGLFVFGFTAHKQGTEIGDRIAVIRGLHPKRFWMRHSDMTGPWGSFTVDFPTEQKTIGDAVVCPEQRDGMSGAREGTHCGNCAVCWSSGVPVAFVTH